MRGASRQLRGTWEVYSGEDADWNQGNSLVPQDWKDDDDDVMLVMMMVVAAAMGWWVQATCSAVFVPYPSILQHCEVGTVTPAWQIRNLRL